MGQTCFAHAPTLVSVGFKKYLLAYQENLSYRFSPSSWGVCYSCELKLILSIHHHSNVSLLVFCYFLISQESKIKVTVGIYCRNNWRKLHSRVLWTTICHSIILINTIKYWNTPGSFQVSNFLWVNTIVLVRAQYAAILFIGSPTSTSALLDVFVCRGKCVF